MAPLVALTGFMGSGKSSVGLATARLLGWEFIDLDDAVVKLAGMTIPEMFARLGEAEFRRREMEALRDVLDRWTSEAGGESTEDGRGLVLALGGGTLMNSEAARLLKQRGRVVWLDVEAERAWERARGGSRPLAQNQQEFSALFAGRRRRYEDTADWVLPVGARTVEQLADEIAKLISTLGMEWPQSWGLQLISTERPSTIIGGIGALASLSGLTGEVLAKGARLFMVTDENVDKAWGEKIRSLSSTRAEVATLVLPAGEQSKTVGSLERCWNWLASQGARRDDVVVAVGGGVVGDLAGFAAATYQRGLGLWQVPTSLLAQVDSSVGGKTAVNLAAGKNLVGAFHQPAFVLVDPGTLITLPQDEFINGLGEVVKYGLLAGEPLFARLEENAHARRLTARELAVMSDVVRTCVRYKATVVDEDERDVGRRAVLNLGHTTAHALEVTLGYGRLSHGRAVALGLLVALVVSERLLGLDPKVRHRTKSLLAILGLPTSLELPPFEAIRTAAARDKKVTAASARFVGLRALGEPVWGLDLPEGLLEEALEVVRG